MKLRRLFSLAALAASFLVVGAQSQAAFISTLGTLQGKVVNIDGLTYTFNTVVLDGSATAAAGATVQTTATGSGFEIIGGGISALTNQTGDVAISYTISSPTPITSLTLVGVGSASGSGSQSIDEFVTGVSGSLHLTSTGTLTLPIPGLTSITVLKDIFVTGGTAIGGSASWSIIDQMVTTTIPEPTSMVLMGTGLVGVVGLGLRRMKSNA
jgi:PEP-CTERM motif